MLHFFMDAIKTACKTLSKAFFKPIKTKSSSLRNVCEKYLQHQQDLYHFFTDFEKAFKYVTKQSMIWVQLINNNNNNNNNNNSGNFCSVVSHRQG